VRFTRPGYNPRPEARRIDIGPPEVRGPVIDAVVVEDTEVDLPIVLPSNVLADVPALLAKCEQYGRAFNEMDEGEEQTPKEKLLLDRARDLSIELARRLQETYPEAARRLAKMLLDQLDNDDVIFELESRDLTAKERRRLHKLATTKT
jgi:hypothetical protein